MNALSVFHSFFCTICVFASALAAEGGPSTSSDRDRSGESPPKTAVCHRVSEGDQTHVYCGNAAQWADLKARVGFRCRNESKKDELCASASEWKRLDLREAANRTHDVDNRDTINALSERNRKPEDTTPMMGVPPPNARMPAN